MSTREPVRLDASSPTTVDPADGDAALKLGARGDDAATRLAGRLDEVAVYDHALSQAELQQHYATGAGRLTRRSTGAPSSRRTRRAGPTRAAASWRLGLTARRGADRVAQHADAVDLALDDVTRLERARRSHELAAPPRRPGEHEVAVIKREVP